MSSASTLPWAWGVLYPNGERAVFLDLGRALATAAQRKGVLVELYTNPKPVEAASCR